MELMHFSFMIIIVVFMLRINSYSLNEPDIFYNIKKILTCLVSAQALAPS